MYNQIEFCLPERKAEWAGYIPYSHSVCLNEKIVCFSVSKLFCSVCTSMDLVLFMYFPGYNSFSWSSRYHKEAPTFEIIICFFQVPQSTVQGHSFLYEDNLSTGFVSRIPSNFICSTYMEFVGKSVF